VVVVVVVVVWWRPHLHRHQCIVPENIRTLDSTEIGRMSSTDKLRKCASHLKFEILVKMISNIMSSDVRQYSLVGNS
jgi:hypothetical protein